MYSLFLTSDRCQEFDSKNGYFVEFIFKKPKKIDINKIQNVLTPEDFAEEAKSNEAFDPNITDFFTAVDSSSSYSKETIRKISIKKYYHIISFNLATQKCMQHQQYN